MGRLMYLALPPTTYPDVCAGLRRSCFAIGPHACAHGSWFRVIMEKVGGDCVDSLVWNMLLCHQPACVQQVVVAPGHHEEGVEL